MKILIINAGSSSLKYQLIDMQGEAVLAKGNVERIGIPGGKLTHKYGADGKFEIERQIDNHTDAVRLVLDALTSREHGVIASTDEIGAVGHRVVHGGYKFIKSTLLDDEAIAGIAEMTPLGPLHNPANLTGISACRAVMPSTPMVAVFDTSFHQTMPPKAYLYALPMDYYRRLHVRRYGFHGTSHRFVSERAVELLGKPESKIVVCHLGNGSSLSAVVNGQCADTSMGLTPLEGVVMGTRSGSLDPAILKFLADSDGLTLNEIDAVLNKKSGLLGLSGVSSDMRDVRAAAAAGNADAITALQVWAYSIRKNVGAYAAAMGGLDAIVFTGGIGENDAQAREEIAGNLEFMGVQLDSAKNARIRGEEAEISAPDSRVKVMVVPTNEELAIARDTLAIAKK